MYPLSTMNSLLAFYLVIAVYYAYRPFYFFKKINQESKAKLNLDWLQGFARYYTETVPFNKISTPGN